MFITVVLSIGAVVLVLVGVFYAWRYVGPAPRGFFLDVAALAEGPSEGLPSKLFERVKK